MATRIRMPMLGLTMAEGTILRWLKKEGEHISKGEPLFEVETDKAIAEVEAPEEGFLIKILAEAEQTVAVGATVGVLGKPHEDITSLLEAAPAVQPNDASNLRPEKQASPEHPRTATHKLISPRARKLADGHRLDWKNLRGTGPEGQVTEEDIHALIAAMEEAKGTLAPAVVRAVPLARVRQMIADRLTKSLQERAHIYLTVRIDMTRPLEMCHELARSGEQVRQGAVGVNDLFIGALGICLTEYPWLNSSLVGQEVHLHSSVNVGFAVAPDDHSLVVPVIRDVQNRDLDQIATVRRRLVGKALKNELSLDELTGGTFTLSNLGMLGVEEFTAIINPPETAILAIGAIVQEPSVVNGGLFIRSAMRVTLGVDHRVVDGALAARFLQRFRNLLEEPRQLIQSKEQL